MTPDAKTKTHFVIVDRGVAEHAMTDQPSLERTPSVSFDKLLNRIAMGEVSEDLMSSLAGRLSLLGGRLGKSEQERLTELGGGKRYTISRATFCPRLTRIGKWRRRAT